MYTALKHSHSGLRYVVLILLITVLGAALAAMLGKKPFTPLLNKLSLYLFIATHLQLTLGIILYFYSPYVVFAADKLQSPQYRYWTIEHTTANIIAVVLISLGRILSKKAATDDAKVKRLFWYTLAGTVVLIISLSAAAGPGIFGKNMAAQ
jgi:hypothetical protein